MAGRKLSRGSAIHSKPSMQLRTLLDVKRALPEMDGLNKRKCADYISALNTIGNMNRLPGERPADVDRALSRIEAEPRLVTKFLDRVKAARTGIKGGSWNNVVSRVRLAIRITGAGPRIGNRGRPIADARFYRLPTLPHQAALGTLVRWLEAEQIPLDEVPSDILRLFGAWLDAVPDMRLSSRTTLLAARRAWNDAARKFPEFWPPVQLTVEYKFSNRYLLPWSSFAPSFQEDVDRRTAHVLDPPLNDEHARAAIARDVARKQEYELRRLASALVAQTGCDPKSIETIATLVKRENFAAILQFLLDRVRKKDPTARTTGGLYISAQFLCNAAANWVRVGDNELKVLRKIANARNPNPASRGAGQRKVSRRGMTKKNREMLGHFRDEAILARFLDLPAALFKRILMRLKKHGRLKRRDAVVLGWAFAMSLLQIAPVRPKNGSGIELGRNLIEQGAGASRRVFVHWVPEEVKNGVELHYELTGEVLELFDLYIKHGRPLLCGPTNPYLFPGRGDRSKQTSWFSTQLAQNLEKELGVRVTGQQFRHLIGFVYLLDHPGDYETVRQFLGHTNIATTVTFYAGIEMQDAAKALDKVVKKRREDLTGEARRSPRCRRP